MAGVEGARGARAAGGRADALVVQQQQQGFALDALKAEADVAGQTVRPVTVQFTVGDPVQPGNQPVPQGAQAGGVGFHPGAGLGEGRCHAHDGGDVLGTGPLVPLLCAAPDERLQRQPLPGIQRADALGPVELVRGEGEQVDLLRLHVDEQMPRSLHRVGVEEHALLPANRADLRNGLDGADLVVGVHDGHQAGILADGLCHLLRGDQAAAVHIQQCHVIALLFQLLQGVQHSVVLKGGGDDVLLAPARAQGSGGQDGLVVRLAAAGGEDDLPRVAAQAACDASTCVLQRLPGLLPEGIQAGGVSIQLIQIGDHGLDGSLAHPGRCGIVCVYHSLLLVDLMGSITYYFRRTYSVYYTFSSRSRFPRKKQIPCSFGWNVDDIAQERVAFGFPRQAKSAIMGA